MSEAEIPQVDPVATDDAAAQPADAAPIVHPKALPIESRFLYVDVAALRAKQLRRGAAVRYRTEQVPLPLKPERVAMEEVRRRLVPYTVPPSPRSAPGARPDAEA